MAIRSDPAHAAPPLEYADLPIDDLIPNPRNPRRHPGAQFVRLRASLNDNGQTRPILARKANLMIVAGHATWQTAKALGWAKIKVVLWDVDQKQADRYMLADNRLADLSEPDVAGVIDLLGQLNEAEYLGAGFSDDEAAKLLAEAESITIDEIETTEVHDDFWISVRGPLIRQAEVLQRVRVLMHEYPDVLIELGNIPIP